MRFGLRFGIPHLSEWCLTHRADQRQSPSSSASPTLPCSVHHWVLGILGSCLLKMYPLSLTSLHAHSFPTVQASVVLHLDYQLTSNQLPSLQPQPHFPHKWFQNFPGLWVVVEGNAQQGSGEPLGLCTLGKTLYPHKGQRAREPWGRSRYGRKREKRAYSPSD